MKLNKLENFNHFWISEKKEYSSFFYFELIVKNYFENIFTGYKKSLNKVILKKKSNYFLIYIYVQQPKYLKKDVNTVILKNNIDKYLFDLNLPLMSKIFIIDVNSKLLAKSYDFSIIYDYYGSKKLKNSLLYLINVSLYCQNARLLNLILKSTLKRTRRHRQYLRSMNFLLKNLFNHYDNFLGYKIQLKGRLNGKERSKKMVINSGSVPLSTINLNLKFDFIKIVTPFGVCGLKTWLSFQKNYVNT